MNGSKTTDIAWKAKDYECIFKPRQVPVYETMDDESIGTISEKWRSGRPMIFLSN